MRRIFQTALEAQHEPTGNPNISLEEEQIMLDEAAQDAAGAEQDLGEAERIIEVSDALEELAVVADNIEEATPAEAQLAEIVGDMAVAGTDVSPEEVVPAMEAFVGRKISTEGIRETARAIWESILKFLKKVWEKIEGYFYRVFGTIPGLRKRIKALGDKVDNSSSLRVEEKSVKITTGIAAITADGKAAKSGAELGAGLKALSEAAGYVYGEYMDNVAKRGEDIAKIVGEFDPEKPAEAAEKLVATLDKHGIAKVPGASSASGSRFSGFDAKMGKALFGGVSLVQKEYKDGDGGSDLGKLDRMRRSGVELVSTHEKSKEQAKEVALTTLTTSEMNALLGDCEALLDKLEDFQRGKRSKELKKSKDSIERESSKASKAFEAAKASQEAGQRAALPYYKALLNFNAAYARWAQSPAMPMMSQALTTIRTVMHCCEKSLTAYK